MKLISRLQIGHFSMRKICFPLVVVVALALATPSVVHAGHETLDTYWPIHSTQRSWNLIGSQQKDLPESKTLMTVTNKVLGENQIELWFSNKQGQVDGQSDIERFEYCANPGGNPWLFLTEYIDKKPGKPTVEHPVASTRILFTPNGGKTYDLIESPKFKWYWDARVFKPAPITNNCTKPGQTVRAMRVQEAWWSNFPVPTGKWALGSGEIGPDGLPTGNSGVFGRSVWHAQGQLPYYLTGDPEGKATDWCTKQIK